MIFIVGYSRSGTKMMNRILEEAEISDRVPEIHFFEQLYNFDDKKKADKKELWSLTDDLIKILLRGGKKLHNGILVSSVEKELKNYVKDAKNDDLSPLDIYKKFVSLINSNRSTDPTPRNAYYINKIASLFPEAKFIYMVRDPRDCILSQSGKWRAYYKENRLIEALRLKLNYNPSLMARFWKNSLNSLRQAEKEGLSNQIYIVQYEKITKNPKMIYDELKNFLGEESNFIPDFNFIRSGNTQKWKSKLSKSELYLIESKLESELKNFGYERSKFSFFEKVKGLFWGIIYWIKLPIAVPLNLFRIKDPFDVLKNRFLKKL